jgi:hypothetical protein
MRGEDVFSENAVYTSSDTDRLRINRPCGKMREEQGTGFIRRQERQEFGHLKGI